MKEFMSFVFPWLLLVVLACSSSGSSGSDEKQDIIDETGLTEVRETTGADVEDDTGIGPNDVVSCEPPATYAKHQLLDIKAEGEATLLNLADPTVIKVADTWYLYATEPGPGHSVWASTDLVTWENRGEVWLPAQDTWNARGQAWAPHVHVADDGYYLYYTADKQIGVALSASPEGPFEEVYDHPLIGGGHGGIGDGVFEYRGTSTPDFDFEEYSIDAFVLEASDGSFTIYATMYNPLSHLIAMPMSDLVTVIPEEMVVITEPDVHSWEMLVNEGPWINEIGGTFILTYSGNGAETSDYALGVAVADSPLGPFVKSDQNPFLKADNGKGIFGPGHHSIVRGYCDDWLLFYHTKVSAEKGWERNLRYAPVSFDGTNIVLPSLP